MLACNDHSSFAVIAMARIAIIALMPVRGGARARAAIRHDRAGGPGSARRYECTASGR